MPSPSLLSVNANLSGLTVFYNGVQFGGQDAPGIVIGSTRFRSTPPMYALRSQFRYDEAGRTIQGIDHVLSVRCVIFESTEPRMGDNMRALRRLLGQVGGRLKLDGLGMGFGFEILYPPTVSPKYYDAANGPKPIALEIEPIGVIAHQLTWTVKFFVSECSKFDSTDPLAWMAFNFNSTWQNDFEGICTRTISGHVIIQTPTDAGLSLLHTAEETRGGLFVVVPLGFRRVQNVWRESVDKSRLDFTIVDEQLPGDNLPNGITQAAGDMSFTSVGGEKDGSMVKGVATLSMSLKTAPNQPKNLAGQFFLMACLAKQAELNGFDADGKATIVVIPIHLNVRNGKFDNSRNTSGTMSWLMVKNLSANLAAANLFESVNDLLTKAGAGQQDFTSWRASMQNLWVNRGLTGTRSAVSESTAINLCNNVSIATIGLSPWSGISIPAATLPTLTCPAVPKDGGWLHYSLKVELFRKDNLVVHRRAASYLPGSSLSQTQQTDPNTGTVVNVGGPTYSQSSSDDHVAEYQGFPEYRVVLTFAALRFSNTPYMPEIKSIDGKQVLQTEVSGENATIAFDAFGCKVWRIEGYRIYKILGQITKMKNTSSILTTTTPLAPSDLPLVL